MLLTAAVIADCSEVAVADVTAETAVLEPATEYETVRAPNARRRDPYRTLPEDVSVTFVMLTLISVADDAFLSAVVRALVRLETADIVSDEPEKEEFGSAVRKKEPVAVDTATRGIHSDAPAADE